MPVMRRRSPVGRHLRPKRQTWHHLRTTRGHKSGTGSKSKHSHNSSEESDGEHELKIQELMNYISAGHDDAEDSAEEREEILANILSHQSEERDKQVR